MKLGDDVLLSIIEALRKAIVEGVDISDLLRDLDLEPDSSTGKLKLSAQLKDIWTTVPTDQK